MGKKSYHAGGANWIFSDGPHGGRNPTEVVRASGEVDGVRLPKEAFYALKAMWRPEPQVHIIGHWNYTDSTIKDMYVISNCAAVKLYVNGDLLGTDSIPDNGYVFRFPEINWESGEIKAEGYINDELRTSQTKVTAGEPVAIKLTPITGPRGWRADGSDVALIDVEVVDDQGRRCPLDKGRVDFTISGAGLWRGGYNSGKERSTNNMYLDTECGINRVAVRSLLQAGTVTVTASKEGLPTASVEISSSPIELIDGLTTELPQVYNDPLGEPEMLPAHTPEMPIYIPDTSTIQRPYGSSIIQIPGMFEAEHYDIGLEGISYHDNEPTNLGGIFRTDGVDILQAPDGGFAISHVAEGEWIEYTVDVAEDGFYDLEVKYASKLTSGILGMEFFDDGKMVFNDFALPQTSSVDWETYNTATRENFFLLQGIQVLRVKIISRGYNLDNFSFTKLSETSVKSLQTDALKVYANPSKSGLFQINKPVRWEVFGLTGIQLKKGEGMNINLSQYSNGVYILKSENKSFKLIIEKK